MEFQFERISQVTDFLSPNQLYFLAYFSIGIVYQIAKFTLFIRNKVKAANEVRKQVHSLWAKEPGSSTGYHVTGNEERVYLSVFSNAGSEEELALLLKKNFRPRFSIRVAVCYAALWPIFFLLEDAWNVIKKPFVWFYRITTGLFNKYSEFLWKMMVGD